MQRMLVAFRGDLHGVESACDRTELVVAVEIHAMAMAVETAALDCRGDQRQWPADVALGRNPESDRDGCRRQQRQQQRVPQAAPEGRADRRTRERDIQTACGGADVAVLVDDRL